MTSQYRQPEPRDLLIPPDKYAWGDMLADLEKGALVADREMD